jgi:hypothetical protein
MRRIFLPLLIALAFGCAARASLPFDTVFKGRSRFDQLVAEADAWKSLPIGDRVGAVGKALCGTPYKSFTLEIDDRVEAPSCNLQGLDCWTFFEVSLAFARMLDEPREKWTPETLLHYIELDRYRNGQCTGSYLSRLHYLEDWLADNNRRGLIEDLTRKLGGVQVPQAADEMTLHWHSYRYMKNNPDLREGIHEMEERVLQSGLYHIPKDRVSAIESNLRTGDIIGITTHDGGRIGTSHVGIAVRMSDGVHFMHASAPRNYGKVVLDTRLVGYLSRFHSDAGIIVGRPLR